MTPDGITDALLDRFDEKYGPRPGLLATCADYVDLPVERERLLRKAFSEAERIGDQKNRELIAHSLAHLFIEDVRDLEEGARWLGIWRDQVGVEPVDYDLAELARLETLLLK